MGIQRLQELSPYVKEALQKTAGLAKLLCLFHVTSTYLCCGVKPVGPSMLPAFKDGDIVLAEKITSRRGKVGSGDAVLIRSPEEPTKVVIKRVKGVEGDVVSYALDPQNSDELKNVTVPKGHVWIEGDNLENSRDSRQFGPVPYGLIHSRIFFVVWPPKDFGSIGNKCRMKLENKCRCAQYSITRVVSSCYAEGNMRNAEPQEGHNSSD